MDAIANSPRTESIMTTPVTLNAIATDVVGHYGNAAKSLVAAYRTASRRALAAGGSRYAKLVERTPLPFVGDEGKARIVAGERRVATVVGEGVERIAQGQDHAIELVSGQALKGLEAFAQRTDWAKDMFVVDTVRRINLPAAKLSLKIASRIDHAASALNARAEGAVKQPAAKPALKKQAAKRTRRAA
jgi:hypothetical protein